MTLNHPKVLFVCDNLYTRLNFKQLIQPSDSSSYHFISSDEKRTLSKTETYKNISAVFLDLSLKNFENLLSELWENWSKLEIPVFGVSSRFLPEKEASYSLVKLENPEAYRLFTTSSSVDELISCNEIKSADYNVDRQQEITKRKAKCLESKFLAHQMNPHFVFNLLSVLQYYVLHNQKLEALEFIGRFSKLMRNALDNSRKDVITIEEEIQFLKNFIDLQKERYEIDFEVLFRVDPCILNGDYGIPPMLVQPFVENAIVHGLKGKGKDVNQITIELKLKKDKIRFKIIDNGVGLDSSKLFSTKDERHGLRKSHGLNIARERLALLNGNSADYQPMKITDRSNKNGTVVEFDCPLIKY